MRESGGKALARSVHCWPHGFNLAARPRITAGESQSLKHGQFILEGDHGGWGSYLRLKVFTEKVMFYQRIPSEKCWADSKPHIDSSWKLKEYQFNLFRIKEIPSPRTKKKELLSSSLLFPASAIPAQQSKECSSGIGIHKRSCYTRNVHVLTSASCSAPSLKLSRRDKKSFLPIFSSLETYIPIVRANGWNPKEQKHAIDLGKEMPKSAFASENIGERKRLSHFCLTMVWFRSFGSYAHRETTFPPFAKRINDSIIKTSLKQLRPRHSACA